MSDNSRAALVGHSGLTYSQWQDRRIAEYLAGARATLSEPHDFDREFVADRDGWMPPLEKILNTVTGEWVTLPEPIRVHVDDLDRVVAEYQNRFLEAWKAARERGCPGCGQPFEDLPVGHTWTEAGSEHSAFCFTVPADQP